MTKKSRDRLLRDELNIPKLEDIVSVDFRTVAGKAVFVKKNMLENQIYRDGPKVARSFDRFAKPYVKLASAVFAKAASIILPHLPDIESDEFKPTVSRLLLTASNSYTASIEVARHGYRRQHGMLSRSIIETLATVIAIATQEGALERFHSGELQSTKCITIARKVLPPIGFYYGLLSNHFVHIGPNHSTLEPPSLYRADQEALSYIINAMRSDVWLYLVVAELVFSDEVDKPIFWVKNATAGVSFSMSPEIKEWSERFLAPVTTEGLVERFSK